MEGVAATPTSQHKSPTLQQEVNELLRFMQQKCNTLSYDDLLKICLDFYKPEEVEKAREPLMKYVSQKNMPKPKGTVKDDCSRNIGVMIKLCLDPSVTLPIFCVISLTRSTPVDAWNVPKSTLARRVKGIVSGLNLSCQLLQRMNYMT